MGALPFETARKNMIVGQLVPGNVLSDAVIEAMQAIPREAFVPGGLQGSAYVDEDLPVAPGRHLLAPLLLAKMIEVAEVSASDNVLDVGCASGYSTAVLARLAAQVVAVEEQMELAERARQLLNRLQVNNAEVITGPLAPGYPSSGPYNVILINGAIQHLPSALTDQLAEGGRLVVVQNINCRPGEASGLGRVMLYRKEAGKVASRPVFDAAASLLSGFEEKRGFVF